MTPRTLLSDRLTTLADPTRGRALLLVEKHELTVGELCGVLQLPQSTVSRHLRVLGDDGWIVSRQEGTSRFYALSPRLDPAADRLWRVVREDLERGPSASHDNTRLAGVLKQRRSKSQEFFAASAAQWDAMRAELFGTTSDLMGLLGLLNDEWTVGDLGCGTGRLTEVLAPNVSQVIGVDASPEMLAAARRRLAAVSNVHLRGGELEALPIEAEQLDAAVLSLVLHYAAEPAKALAEVYRTLKPSGRLLMVDMLPHDRVDYQQQMGHIWLGFSEAQMKGWLTEVGFSRQRFRPLLAERAAKGPTLFVASAAKPPSEGATPARTGELIPS